MAVNAGYTQLNGIDENYSALGGLATGSLSKSDQFIGLDDISLGIGTLAVAMHLMTA